MSEPAASQPDDAGPAAVGPIAYYVAKCARCHGDIAASYEGVTRPQTGKQLEATIDEMAYGPAQAPLDAKGLKDQTALHEAMFRKQAFVWLDESRKDKLAGELLPGTTLTAEPAAKIKVAGTTFELPRQKGVLIAKRGEHVLRVPIEP